jgi:predicted transcriptional regulator
MAKPSEPVTDAELELLKVLWQQQPLTVREITAALYEDLSNSNNGTVQKLLQRLEAKRCVQRDRRTYAHRFSVIVTQASVAGKQLEVMADKVSDGSLAPFITHLVQNRRLTKKEKQDIRKMLED